MKKYKVLITISIIICIICISNFSKADSNGTDLKSLSIEPSGYELTQDESNNKIYRVKVDNSVTSIKVNAVPNNKDTTISVNGNSELSVGTNKVTVSLTAKNGDKSVYTIYVRRASTPIAQEKVIPNVQDEYIEEKNDSIENKNDNIDENNKEEENDNTIVDIDLNKENSIQTNNNETTINNTEKIESYENIRNDNKKAFIMVSISVVVIMVIILCMFIISKSKGKH